MKILNIYGQEMEHCDARIIGNKEGLMELRDTINNALMSGEKAKPLQSHDPLFASDGEGYSVLVECRDDKWGIEGGDDSFWNKEESYPEYTRLAGQ